MSQLYRCAIDGFDSGESQMLISFFRMTANLGIAFEFTPALKMADIVVFNADDAECLKLAEAPGFKPKVLFVGNQAPSPACVLVPRPIRLTKVLQALQNLVSEAQGSVPATAQPPLPERAPPASAKASVLVIDDSDLARNYMRGRLGRFGFQVDVADSGEEALLRAREHNYNLVFIDVMMEGLDGYQTCRLLKKRRAGAEAPVAVMLSSRGGTIDKIRGSLAGCDAYLTKPVSEADLMQVLVKHALIHPGGHGLPQLQPRNT